ncbi:MAG: hypothetical protein ABI462_09035 [Ignavibacteria bacterium]
MIHTQASWLASNQNYARTLMNLHLPPQAIIDSMVLHYAQNKVQNIIRGFFQKQG